MPAAYIKGVMPFKSCAGPAPDLVIFHHSFALENGPFIDDKNDAIYIEKEIHTTLYKKITIGH